MGSALGSVQPPPKMTTSIAEECSMKSCGQCSDDAPRCMSIAEQGSHKLERRTFVSKEPGQAAMPGHHGGTHKARVSECSCLIRLIFLSYISTELVR
jgi:hypothetical protein